MKRGIILDSAVERAVIRSGSPFSAVLNSFHYSRETHASGSESHGYLTLHFVKNGNEKRAKSLTSTLSTAVFRIIVHFKGILSGKAMEYFF
jgi:hypothetical protein